MTTESSAGASITAPNASPVLRQGRTPASAGSGDVAQQQLAWQREMERAQMTGWFKPASIGGKEAAAEGIDRSVDERARGPGDSGKRGKSERMWQVKQPEAGGLSSAAATATGPLVVNPQREGGIGANAFAIRAAVGVPTQTPAAAEVELPITSDLRIDAKPPHRQGLQASVGMSTETPPREEESADAASDAFQAKSPEQPAPLRLHQEMTPQGQAVWIAMRADDEALAGMLPRLVADLQQGLLERGQRLHQVVCNGCLVWRDGTLVPVDDQLISRIDDNRRAIFDSINSREA